MKLNALLQIEQQPAQGQGLGPESGLLLAAVRSYVTSFLTNGVYVNALIHGNLPSSGAATLATSIRTAIKGLLVRNGSTSVRANSATSGLTNTALQHTEVLSMPAGRSRSHYHRVLVAFFRHLTHPNIPFNPHPNILPRIHLNIPCNPYPNMPSNPLLNTLQPLP